MWITVTIVNHFAFLGIEHKMPVIQPLIHLVCVMLDKTAIVRELAENYNLLSSANNKCPSSLP